MSSKIVRLLGVLVSLMLCVASAGARADVKTVRVAKQFGISYLTLTVMEEKKLIEKHAKAMGLDVNVEWLRFSAGSGMNEALLSGNLDFASGGITPLLTIWGKTYNNLKVKGVVGLNTMPYYLLTTNSKVKTVKDFTEKDKIALPGVKTSIQAVLLQLAVEAAFGPGQQGKLDALTVSMGHPDAMAAMLSGISEIDAHFATEPFQTIELADPRVHKVLDSYEIVGGEHTNNAVWATTRFVESNPDVTKAFIAAVEESEALIKASPAEIAKLWIQAEGSKLPEADAEKIIRDPRNNWTTAPKKFMYFLDYMNRAGLVSTKATSWKDIFFSNIHGADGS